MAATATAALGLIVTFYLVSALCGQYSQAIGRQPSSSTLKSVYNGHQAKYFSVIAFDSYGTLLDITSVTRRLRRITSSDAVAAAFNQHWRAKQLAYTQLRTIMDRYVDFGQITRDAFENTLNAYGIRNLTHAEKKYQLDSWETMDAFPDVSPSLAKLQASGYRLVVLSNGSPAMLTNGWTHSNLIGYFDQLISVDAIRKYKPHPEVYKMAEKYTCTPRARILFVSSNSFDVTGAKRIGLTTAWINRLNQSLESTDNLGFIPNYVFGDMHEFVKHYIVNMNPFLKYSHD